MKIRLEEEKDYRKVEELTREAFWNLYTPGCSEHFMLHNLRKSPAFIKELDFILEEDGEILGHIAYSHSKIIDEENVSHRVITFGPISVLPSYQNKGIGSALINHSLREAKALGYKAVCIYGDPRYYGRFGFRCGDKFDIKTSDGKFAAALMALELTPGALDNISGRLFEDSSFEVNNKEFEVFESTFPYKEKLVTESQRDFQIIASLRY